MADEEVSLFLVASFGGGPYYGGIYEIKFRVGGGGGSEIPIVSLLQKAFSCSEKRRPYSPVGCDISGSDMLLVASYMDINVNLDINFTQFQPYLFNTNTKKLLEYQYPKTTKPFPMVMAVRGRFYVLARGTMVPSYDKHILPPSFELLDPMDHQRPSFLPEFRLDDDSSKIVSGFAVIEDDWILISVSDYVSDSLPETEYYCYKVGSSMMQWKTVEKEEEEEEYNVLYYPFCRKAEYVDCHVYTFGDDSRLIAYPVRFSDDGIIQSLGAPVFLPSLSLLELPDYFVPAYDDTVFTHLGHKIFCIMRTGFNEDPSDLQFLFLSILKVSDEMQCTVLHSDICALRTENLYEANLTSLCFDSQ